MALLSGKGKGFELIEETLLGEFVNDYRDAKVAELGLEVDDFGLPIDLDKGAEIEKEAVKILFDLN